MNILWAGLLSVSALAALAVFLNVFPRCSDAVYQSELWRLRERLVADIRADQLKLSPEVTSEVVDLLASIRSRIANARELSPYRLLPVKMALARCPEIGHADGSDASVCESEQLAAYVTELDHIDRRHLSSGSPTGWLLYLVTICYRIVGRVAHAIGLRVPIAEDRLGVGSMTESARQPELVAATRRRANAVGTRWLAYMGRRDGND